MLKSSNRCVGHGTQAASFSDCSATSDRALRCAMSTSATAKPRQRRNALARPSRGSYASRMLWLSSIRGVMLSAPCCPLAIQRAQWTTALTGTEPVRRSAHPGETLHEPVSRAQRQARYRGWDHGRSIARADVHEPRHAATHFGHDAVSSIKAKDEFFYWLRYRRANDGDCFGELRRILPPSVRVNSLTSGRVPGRGVGVVGASGSCG